MKQIFFILLFMTTLLSAESNDVSSELILDSESFALKHESTYGVTTSYSFLVAEHQIHTDGCLLFYYGTKIGYVIEDYTAENGFGPDAEKHGAIIKANLGVEYDLKRYQKLSFEGSHAQNELFEQTESQVKIGYQYRF